MLNAFISIFNAALPTAAKTCCIFISIIGFYRIFSAFLMHFHCSWIPGKSQANIGKWWNETLSWRVLLDINAAVEQNTHQTLCSLNNPQPAINFNSMNVQHAKNALFNISIRKWNWMAAKWCPSSGINTCVDERERVSERNECEKLPIFICVEMSCGWRCSRRRWRLSVQRWRCKIESFWLRLGQQWQQSCAHAQKKWKNNRKKHHRKWKKKDEHILDVYQLIKSNRGARARVSAHPPCLRLYDLSARTNTKHEYAQIFFSSILNFN